MNKQLSDYNFSLGICHNLEWQLGQNEKYANTHHVWHQISLEISFAFSKWGEVGKVFYQILYIPPRATTRGQVEVKTHENYILSL